MWASYNILEPIWSIPQITKFRKLFHKIDRIFVNSWAKKKAEIRKNLLLNKIK